LVGCVLGGVAGGVGREALAQSPGAAAARTRWVFLCEQAVTGPEVSALMNRTGRDGWELAGTGGDNVWCFKKFATQR
jgi:hypothetical protein